MIVEIINTGSELLLGRVLNTHQQWLCRQLADAGYVVSRQIAVADTADEIATAVRESLSRADVVITTGGLGPTSDDLTRETIASLLGRTLVEDPVVWQQIQSRFTRRNRPVPARTRAEAQVPAGATVLPNHFGTAPGLAMETGSATRPQWLMMLPGPPRELHPMFTDFGLPLIRRVLPSSSAFVCRTFRTNGIGESQVQERIELPLGELVASGLEIGYCARPGQVDVRFVARGSEAQALVSRAEAILRAELGACLYADGDCAMEDVIIARLTERGQTVCVAESCTGGLIADRLTNVPGASAVFAGGFIVYSNDLKQRLLGVAESSLVEHGAVSESVARQMAEGARRSARTDFAIAVTGIAGPGGGTVDKPVGTVFIAVARADGTTVRQFLNAWDRRTFKEVTSQQALDLLRSVL